MLNIKMNPVTKKELISSSRTIRVPLMIIILDVISFVICIAAISYFKCDHTANSLYSGYGEDPTIMWLGERGRWFGQYFKFILVAQFGIMMTMLPVFCGSSIAEERQQQTFEMLITTGYSNVKIVIGKMIAGLSIIAGYVISMMPFIIVMQVVYNFTYVGLFSVTIAMITTGILCAAIGVCAGAKRYGTKTASVAGVAWFAALSSMSILLIMADAGMKSIIYNWEYYTSDNSNIVYRNVHAGWIKYIIVTNPIIVVAQAISHMCDGGNVLKYIQVDYSDTVSYPEWFIDRWYGIAILCQLIMSVFFTWWASKRINPLRKINKYKKTMAAGNYTE